MDGTDTQEKDTAKVRVSLWGDDEIEVHRSEIPVLRGQGILTHVDGEPEEKPAAAESEPAASGSGSGDAAKPAAKTQARTAPKEN